MAILISNKVDFTVKINTNDSKGHFTRIKGPINEDLTIQNIQSTNNTASKYMKLKLMELQREVKKIRNLHHKYNAPLNR